MQKAKVDEETSSNLNIVECKYTRYVKANGGLNVVVI